MMLRAAIAVLALTLPAAALADGYIGGQFAHTDYTEDGVNDSLNAGAFLLRGGGRANEYFSAEARFGFGIYDDTVTVYGVDVTGEIDSIVTGLARGHVPIGDNGSSIYVAAGISDVEGTLSAGGGSLTFSETDPSFGFGLELMTGGQGAVTLEWMSYLDGTEDGYGYELTALSVGFQRNF